MSDRISILIADDNIDFGNLLSEYLDREEDLSVAGVARDGLQTLEMAASLEPDIVLLDVVMPNLDGIGVLEHLVGSAPEKKPLFIMLSAIGQENFIQRAINLGAEYYLVKPFDVEVLVSRIRQIYAEKRKNCYSGNRKVIKGITPVKAVEVSENDLAKGITAVIREIGIPAHISGYQYIREAILQTINVPNVFVSVTKLLYPAVAAKYKTTPQKVERAIRNAIEVAWTKKDVNLANAQIEQVFGSIKGKPTNSEFIAATVDWIKIKYNLK